MQIEFTIEKLDIIIQEHIISQLSNKSIFTFSGPLGAGKTTIIKAIFKQCGITDVVTSPTFSYVNSYKTPDNKIFNHFDLYRIDSLESFIYAGLNEYLDNLHAYNFIEWPEVINALLENPDLQGKTCHFTLQHVPTQPNRRIIKW